MAGFDRQNMQADKDFRLFPLSGAYPVLSMTVTPTLQAWRREVIFELLNFTGVIVLSHPDIIELMRGVSGFSAGAVSFKMEYAAGVRSVVAVSKQDFYSGRLEKKPE